MWRFTTAVFVILLIISVLTGGFGLKSTSSGAALSKEDAAQKGIGYINENLLTTGTEAELQSIEEKGNLYFMKMDIAGREYESYITKDGIYLFPTGFNMDEVVDTPEVGAGAHSG